MNCFSCAGQGDRAAEVEILQDKTASFLQAKGVVRLWQKGMVVIFVSHQWLSSHHPDPQGSQLSVLHGALQNIIEQKVVVESDVVSQMIFSTKKSMTAAEGQNLKDAYIWYDWFSVPQPSVCQSTDSTDEMIDETKKNMLAAVNSIPGYVERSKLILVLAPPLKHEATGEMCNVASWKVRGWCRVELACQCLSQGEGEILLVTSATQISFMSSIDWMFSVPGKGNYTVDSDREPLFPLMNGLLQKNIRVHRRRSSSRQASNQNESLFKYRFFTSMRSNLLAGLAPPTEDVFAGEDTEVARLLSVNQFSSPSDDGEQGWGPLMMAAVEGNLRVIQGLLSAGADVNSRTRQDNMFTYMKKGSTPLMVAAFLSGNLECLTCLLDMKADVGAEDSNNSTALHYATWADRPEVVEMLVDHGSDIEKADSFGSRPLHTSALFASARAAEVLLRMGASVHPLNGFGCTPLQCLVTFNDAVEIAELLISKGALVNYRQYPEALPLRILCRGCQVMSWLKVQESAFVRLFAEIPGNNAIGLASMRGSQELCEVLIKKGRAEPHWKNDMGHDSFDLALIGGHPGLPAWLRTCLADRESQDH